jgi:hypothetical protein
MDRDALLLELFRADQVGGVVSEKPVEEGGIDVSPDVFFEDPSVVQKRAAQTGGGARRRRRVTRKVRGRNRSRHQKSTLRLNLRAQIRLRSQRRH